MEFLLRGIGGSTAYGLAREGSDQDMIGVFGHPTSAFWSLEKPQESIVRHEPGDEAYHELEKFLRLACKSNPTVLEILALDSYVERNAWGEVLIEHRSAFLSERYVMNAFIGYSESQFRKMVQAGNADARSRSPKNARHMIRLLEQGHHLYATGELRVKVPDPQRYWDYETWNIEQMKDEFTRMWELFVSAKTCLPSEPDMRTVNRILYEYRAAHL